MLKNDTRVGLYGSVPPRDRTTAEFQIDQGISVNVKKLCAGCINLF